VPQTAPVKGADRSINMSACWTRGCSFFGQALVQHADKRWYASGNLLSLRKANIVGPVDRLSELCDVMHLLSPAAWKVVMFVARDDLIRYAEETSWGGALRRDLYNAGGIDIEEPTGPEERADLVVVSNQDPAVKWTQLSLAQICGGVRVSGKRHMQNCGTGLTKSSAVVAINEAVHLGVLRHRRNRARSRGYVASSYSICWERVAELALESKTKSNVRTTRKFGRTAK
jgi:hypothetical protein